MHGVCLNVDDSDDNETTSTSTSSVSCSPRWIVYPNTAALGAWRNRAATTQQQCLDACLTNSSCVAVDWSYDNHCWMHDQRRDLVQRPVTHFELVERCKSSTWRHHVRLIVVYFPLLVIGIAVIRIRSGRLSNYRDMPIEVPVPIHITSSSILTKAVFQLQLMSTISI